MECASKEARRLAEMAFVPISGARVVMLGHGGFLQDISPCAVRIIIVCGDFSGNQQLARLDCILPVWAAVFPWS